MSNKPENVIIGFSPENKITSLRFNGVQSPVVVDFNWEECDMFQTLTLVPIDNDDSKIFVISYIDNIIKVLLKLSNNESCYNWTFNVYSVAGVLKHSQKVYNCEDYIHLTCSLQQGEYILKAINNDTELSTKFLVK